MTRSALTKMPLRFLILSLALSTLGGCTINNDDKPFDPAAIASLYRDRATQNVTPPMPPRPEGLDRTFLTRREGREPASQPSTRPIGPARRMRLRELIQLAAANALDVRVAGYQPAIDEARVTEAEAQFDPVFFSNFNFQNQWVLTPNAANPFGTFRSENNFETAGIQSGFRQRLPSGAQMEVKYSFQRTFRFTNSTSERSFDSDMQFQITQPLLQNFGTEVNRARITVARNTQRVSLLDFRLALEKNLSEIEQAYWQLVLAERELVIQEQLFQQTIDTSRILQARVGQDVTRVQLGQTNAALRSREASLVEARTRVRTLSNAIKRRVNDPDMPVTSPEVILPGDNPVDTSIAFDLVEQIETGLQNRAELSQQRIRIDSASVVQKAAKNNLLPTLNLVLSVGNKSADPQAGPAFRDQFDFNFREYAAGIQLEIPLGNREARAIYRRTQLQRLQAIDQYKSLIEQVVQEVKDAHDDVYAGWERIVLGRQSVLAAEDALDAIVQEETVGNVPLTPDFVNRKLNAQEVLAQARREYQRAVADYNTAISTLERAKGTLLKYDNILLAEDPTAVKGPELFK